MFTALVVDGLTSVEQCGVKEFFCAWAARNHLHVAWQMQFVPRVVVEEVLSVTEALMLKKVVLLLSHVPGHF